MLQDRLSKGNPNYACRIVWGRYPRNKLGGLLGSMGAGRRRKGRCKKGAAAPKGGGAFGTISFRGKRLKREGALCEGMACIGKKGKKGRTSWERKRIPSGGHG